MLLGLRVTSNRSHVIFYKDGIAKVPLGAQSTHLMTVQGQTRYFNSALLRQHWSTCWGRKIRYALSLYWSRLLQTCSTVAALPIDPRCYNGAEKCHFPKVTISRHIQSLRVYVTCVFRLVASDPSRRLSTSWSRRTNIIIPSSYTRRWARMR